MITPTTGPYSRTGLSRLTELASLTMPEREQGQDSDAWVADHILLAIEEGPQSTRYNNICMEMKWMEDWQMMTLVIQRCVH